MVLVKRLLTLTILSFLFLVNSSNQDAFTSRSLASRNQSCLILTKKFLVSSIWTIEKKELALQIMLAGSDDVSRTISMGRRFMAPGKVRNEDISIIAQDNYIKAARYVLDNIDNLKVNRNTAIKLNKILTEKLVPEKRRGSYLFRHDGPYVDQTDSFIGKDPTDFYKWLESDESREIYRLDPVRFAEIIHNNISALDSFPDGNGRLSRLFADLALMKAGRAPAFYTDMEDYFARGNARSSVGRDVRVSYYREIAKRGQMIVNGEKSLESLKSH